MKDRDQAFRQVDHAFADPAVRAAVELALEEAAVSDTKPVTDSLVGLVGRAGAQRDALRHAALYPVVLSVVAVIAALSTNFIALPGLSRLGFDAPTSGSAFLNFAFVTCIVVLAALVVSALSNSSRFPLAQARHAQDAALALGTASVLVTSDVSLARALSASAKLVNTMAVREEIRVFASALSQDRDRVAVPSLLSPLASALLRAASAEGIEASVLQGISRVSASEAQRKTKRAITNVEVVSLAVAGAAIALVAIGYMSAYTGAYGGPW